MLSNNILEAFFAEHLSCLILGFPDSVCADQNDLSGCDCALKFLDGKARIFS
jgi:hypothetical protein